MKTKTITNLTQIFLFLLLTTSLSAASSEAIFRTKPYLQNPTGNGITVTWLTNVPVYSWVEYGTDSTKLSKAHTIVDGQVISNNKLHKIRLHDLMPEQTYYYRICSREITSYQAYSKTFGETAQSAFSTFTLPSEKTTDFTAVVFNDLHKRKETLKALCSQLNGIDYDFVFFNGDCIDDPSDENNAVAFLTELTEAVGADHTPIFFLRGNHEIRNAYSIELRSLMDYVGDKTYSAFSWGDTRFVQMDCGEDKPDSTPVYYGLNDFSGLRMDQVGFLKKEFKTKAFKKAEKRILIHHIPIFGITDEYNPCKELWGELLNKQKFDLSVNGHMHQFAFHEPGTAQGNKYPVVVGGGPSMDGATVILLQKKGKELKLRVLNAKGEQLLERIL
jgi:predicted MPP superfamily phosphohydrolase